MSYKIQEYRAEALVSMQSARRWSLFCRKPDSSRQTVSSAEQKSLRPLDIYLLWISYKIYTYNKNIFCVKSIITF